MARINLLPWRAEQRKLRQRQFLTVLAVTALLGGATWFGIVTYIDQLIAYQQSRNQFLTAAIATLDKKIAEIEELERERERLLARMRAIDTLQTSRPLVVRLFDEIVTTLPEGLFLKEIKQAGTVVTVRGSARSNALVSSFMREIERSQWITNPKLQVIENTTEANERVAAFTVTFEQVIPKDEPEEEASAGITAPERGAGAGTS